MNAQLVFKLDKPLISKFVSSYWGLAQMPERKRKNDIETFCVHNIKNDLLKNGPIELSDGCSISMDYDEDTPTMYVKTYGEVDVASLRRKLKQHIPGARIEGLNLEASVALQVKKRKKIPGKKSLK
jgi:hypothetical protein